MRKSICVIVKDEQDTLPEWIEYHTNLGFDHFFIFEDFTSQPHCLDYSNVTIIPVRDIWVDKEAVAEYGRTHNLHHARRTQDAVFDYFLHNYKEETDWCAFIDPDEFIFFDKGYSLDTLMAEYKDYAGVLLSWKMYNANGRVHKSQSVIGSYRTWVEPFGVDTTWDFKSFVNMQKAEYFDNIHRIHGGVSTHGLYDCRENGRLNYDKAWINHYYTKSWEDWVKRLKRGNMYNNFRTIDDFFAYNPDMVPLKEELISSMEISYENFKYCTVLSREMNIRVFPTNKKMFCKLNHMDRI